MKEFFQLHLNNHLVSCQVQLHLNLYACRLLYTNVLIEDPDVADL